MKWKINLLLIAVLAVSLVMTLGAGCFDGPNHQQYQSCNVDVNVVVDNNHADQHEFTHLVEMVQVEDQTCSCPSGYSLNDGVCTKTIYGECLNCLKTWIDTSHWGPFGSSQDCPHHHETIICAYPYCKDDGTQGTKWNHEYHSGQSIPVTVYDCHIGNDAYTQSGCSVNHEKTRSWITEGHWQYNCHTGDPAYSTSGCSSNKEKSVTILTAAQTCTCPQGFTHVGGTCEKVVDSETVTSTHSDPAEVHLVYQFDSGWGGFFGSWCWHLKWHDRFGDHDRRFEGFDQDKTYVIRVTDVSTNGEGYSTDTPSQSFTTSICGGDIFFHYTGPSCLEGQTRCESGQCCNLNTDPNNCGTCGNVCPEGQTCSGGECNGGNGGGAGTEGGAGVGNDGVGPGGNVVQFVAAFTPYCDYQATDRAPALVTFVDKSTYPHRTSAIFDFGDGYITIDECLSDAFNGMGTPENVSVCELRQRVYAEPDPAPVNYLNYIRVQHLYANPGTYSITLTDTWDLGNLISPPYSQIMTIRVKQGTGGCRVLSPGDTYHKPFYIQIS